MSLIESLTFQKGTGWFPNHEDKRDFDIDKLCLSSHDLPSQCSMRIWADSVRNQGGTSSCVGQAIANAVSIREALVYAEKYPKRKALPASALFPYWNGRWQHNASKVDQGTFIRLGVKSMVDIGIPDEHYWKFSTLRVNKQPSGDAYMHAHGRRGGLYVTIRDVGTSRADVVKAALAANLPVIFGATIDKAFFANNGPSVIGLPQSTVGGHAMVLIGYKYDSAYGTIYEILNSWGPSWRVGGRAWITEQYLRHMSSVRDLTVVHGWKNIV